MMTAPLMPPTIAPDFAAPARKTSLVPALGSETAARETPENGSSMSHVCNWPGCGKGFTSRWLLERHLANHQRAFDGGLVKSDTFMERRLRERLKSVQQAREKAREKLSSLNWQQEHLDTALHVSRLSIRQQQEEMHMLEQQNAELAARIPARQVQELLASTYSAATLKAPPLESVAHSLPSGTTPEAMSAAMSLFSSTLWTAPGDFSMAFLPLAAGSSSAATLGPSATLLPPRSIAPLPPAPLPPTPLPPAPLPPAPLPSAGALPAGGHPADGLPPPPAAKRQRLPGIMSSHVPLSSQLEAQVEQSASRSPVSESLSSFLSTVDPSEDLPSDPPAASVVVPSPPTSPPPMVPHSPHAKFNGRAPTSLRRVRMHMSTLRFNCEFAERAFHERVVEPWAFDVMLWIVWGAQPGALMLAFAQRVLTMDGGQCLLYSEEKLDLIIALVIDSSVALILHTWLWYHKHRPYALRCACLFASLRMMMFHSLCLVVRVFLLADGGVTFCDQLNQHRLGIGDAFDSLIPQESTLFSAPVASASIAFGSIATFHLSISTSFLPSTAIQACSVLSFTSVSTLLYGTLASFSSARTLAISAASFHPIWMRIARVPTHVQALTFIAYHALCTLQATSSSSARWQHVWREPACLAAIISVFLMMHALEWYVRREFLRDGYGKRPALASREELSCEGETTSVIPTKRAPSLLASPDESQVDLNTRIDWALRVRNFGRGGGFRLILRGLCALLRLAHLLFVSPGFQLLAFEQELDWTLRGWGMWHFPACIFTESFFFRGACSKASMDALDLLQVGHDMLYPTLPLLWRPVWQEDRAPSGAIANSYLVADLELAYLICGPILGYTLGGLSWRRRLVPAIVLLAVSFITPGWSEKGVDTDRFNLRLNVFVGQISAYAFELQERRHLLFDMRKGEPNV